MRVTDLFRSLTPKQKGWLPYIVLATAVFAAYANVYQNAFMMNDLDFIVNNDPIRHWRSLPDLLDKTTLDCFYRPVQLLFYFFIYQIFGLSLAAFHGANVMLQAINTCLMYRLGGRLGFYQRASFAAALLWGIHPLWIEAVAVVAGTADLLAVFFLLTGLLVLLPGFKPRKFWLAIPLFVLALGSKENAVVFPALVTLTLFLVNKERLRPVTYLKTGPLWLMAIAYIAGWAVSPVFNCLAGVLIHSADHIASYESNFINRILTSLATLPVYFGLMMTPANLRIAWVFPIFTTVWDWHVIAGAGIVALSFLQMVWGRGRRGLPLTWGLLWFAAALSPNTGIVKPIDGQLFEHWIYLPAVGLFLGVSQTVAAWIETGRSKIVPVIAAGLVALAVLVLGTKTWLQNEILRDRGSVFESILQYMPQSAWAHHELGLFYLEQGEFDKAIVQFQYIIDSLGTAPDIAFMDIHWKIAMAYLHLSPDKDGATFTLEAHTLQSCQHIPEVIGELGKVLQGNPDYAPAHEVLAAIYRYRGNSQMADFHERKVKSILQGQNK
jgi:hypothetical protein